MKFSLKILDALRGGHEGNSHDIDLTEKIALLNNSIHSNNEIMSGIKYSCSNLWIEFNNNKNFNDLSNMNMCFNNNNNNSFNKKNVYFVNCYNKILYLGYFL